MILTVTDGEPGRVQITLYEGHGADQKAVRHELTLYELYQVHRACTEALYAHAKENEALGRELKRLANAITPHVNGRGDNEHARRLPDSGGGTSARVSHVRDLAPAD